MDSVESLDMVKVRFVSTSDNVAALVQQLWDKKLNLGEEWQGQHWTSAKYEDFEHTWTFPCGDSVLTLLWGHNTQAGKLRKSGALEWNPNKVNLQSDPDLWRMVKNLLMFAKTFELTKADVAYDLPGVAIHQCTMDMVKKADCRFYMGRSGSMTIYSGARGSNGSCKVYDKRQELLDKGKPDVGTMTRYEITYKCNITFMRLMHDAVEFCGGIMPGTIPELVVMNQPELDRPIDFEDHIMIAGLQQLPHLYCKMSRYKRKRLKALECVNTFAPSIESADLMLKNWFIGFYETIIA